ncbi:hypothetical protein AB0H77_25670 [Streptomyces sp. NPDC050844]|uniref:hypothetical protein n=1 Tax=Streptomyces sp. NPDC050844 TaxID=3155790 RepID=UPI0033FFA03B
MSRPVEPRSAAAAGKDFPYTASTTCYIEVHEDGTVTHGDDRAAYERAVDGKSRLFAVWPGEWSSHLFAIDDLDEYAKAHGIKRDEERTGLKEHVHEVQWEPDSFGNDNPRSPYISISVSLNCGCSIHDLSAFAAEMREQRGWDVAKSGGWGSSSGARGNYVLAARSPQEPHWLTSTKAAQHNGWAAFAVPPVPSRAGEVLWDVLGNHTSSASTAARPFPPASGMKWA